MTSLSTSYFSSATPGLHGEAININEESSLNFWLAALECNELQLRVAVAEVGPCVVDVGNALGRHLS